MLRAGVLPGCLFWKQAGDSGRGCRWWGKYTGGGGAGGTSPVEDPQPLALHLCEVGGGASTTSNVRADQVRAGLRAAAGPVLRGTGTANSNPDPNQVLTQEQN